jgi:hypothetical protein
MPGAKGEEGMPGLPGNGVHSIILLISSCKDEVIILRFSQILLHYLNANEFSHV